MTFRHSGQCTECRCVSRGDVSQNFAVYLYIGLFEAVDQAAVAEIIVPGRRIDAGNPQPTEIAFAVTAISIRIEKGFEHGLIGTLE